MTEAEIMETVAKALGLPGWAGQILACNADVTRTQVDYKFDASSFFLEHVGLVFVAENASASAAEVGRVVRAAIAGSNFVAGGGAAGYLAVINLMMIAFREDYIHADALVRRYVLEPHDDVPNNAA